MRRATAAISTTVFFIVAPGCFVGVIPWLISHWELHQPLPGWIIAQLVGAALILGGLVPVISAFAEFVKAGGTPIPAAPTQHLVVSGFNRYVRNPMYVGLLTALLGEALLFGNLGVLIFAAGMWLVVAIFVRFYEEPTLARTYGAEYETYRQAVPAWRPRLHPWTNTAESHP